MALDFPATPTTGQTFDPGTGIVYAFDGVAWNAVTSSTATAERRNRIVNPSVQVSVENGDTASAVGPSYNYYPADQWVVGWLLPGTAQSQRTRPADTGSDVVMFYASTASPTLTGSHYAAIQQFVEGYQIKDFLWGTAAAKQVIVRFNFWTNVAGTYSLSIANGASPDRTYLASFTAPASQWRVYTFVIPGDVTGTWKIDNNWGIVLSVGLAASTGYGSGIAGWQAGYRLQMAGNTNGAAAAGNTFYLTDVGLYLDPQKTGLAPAYETPDLPLETVRCQRYWQTRQIILNPNTVSSVTPFGVTMRTIPTISNLSGAAGFATGIITGTDAEIYGTRAYCWVSLNAR